MVLLWRAETVRDLLHAQPRKAPEKTGESRKGLCGTLPASEGFLGLPVFVFVLVVVLVIVGPIELYGLCIDNLEHGVTVWADHFSANVHSALQLDPLSTIWTARDRYLCLGRVIRHLYHSFLCDADTLWAV
jgi:hypothetical protein